MCLSKKKEKKKLLQYQSGLLKLFWRETLEVEKENGRHVLFLMTIYFCVLVEGGPVIIWFLECMGVPCVYFASAILIVLFTQIGLRTAILRISMIIQITL